MSQFSLVPLQHLHSLVDLILIKFKFFIYFNPLFIHKIHRNTRRIVRSSLKMLKNLPRSMLRKGHQIRRNTLAGLPFNAIINLKSYKDEEQATFHVLRFSFFSHPYFLSLALFWYLACASSFCLFSPTFFLFLSQQQQYLQHYIKLK